MMNKFRALILAALWIIIAILLTVFLVRLTPRFNFNFSWGQNVSFTNQPLYKDYHFTAADITSLSTDVISESVHVKTGGTTDVVVELRGNGWAEDTECSVTANKGVLQIASPRKLNFSYRGSRSIIIYVPSSLAGSGKLNANIHSTSGSVHSNDISYDAVELHSTSGSVHLTNTTANTVILKSTSGSTHFEGTADSLSSQSTSGSVHAKGAFRQFNCSSTSGSVHVEDGLYPTEDCSAKTVSGSVHVTLPEESTFVLDYHAISGTVYNGFTGSKLKKSGSETVGSGSIVLSASSTSGSIHINKD